MARLARLVVPDLPHHVTQRGARRMQVFFSHGDYRAYLRLLARQAARHDVAIWAYCLMPNHVHLIAVPTTNDGLARSLAEAHRRYAYRVNRRSGWTGHLWQQRFFSFPMEEARAVNAIRYVLLNPVRAGLAATAGDWPYSSARSQIAGRPDDLVEIQAIPHLVPDWGVFLSGDVEFIETDEMRRQTRSGLPLGSDRFVDDLERVTGRRLRPLRRGRKPSSDSRPVSSLSGDPEK
jgi:putative transposase